MKKQYSILGNLFPTQIDLMNHLAEYGTLTDENIILKNTSIYGGIDVESILSTMLERDFCKDAINNIIEALNKIK